MSSDTEHNEMLVLLKENSRLLNENNILLKKLHKWSLFGFWLRIIWYALIIGFPFALYFYILEPYFNALGSNYEVFRQGISEVPGLKGLEHLLPTVGK